MMCENWKHFFRSIPSDDVCVKITAISLLGRFVFFPPKHLISVLKSPVISQSSLCLQSATCKFEMDVNRHTSKINTVMCLVISLGF